MNAGSNHHYHHRHHRRRRASRAVADSVRLRRHTKALGARYHIETSAKKHRVLPYNCRLCVSRRHLTLAHLLSHMRLRHSHPQQKKQQQQQKQPQQQRRSLRNNHMSNGGDLMVSDVISTRKMSTRLQLTSETAAAASSATVAAAAAKRSLKLCVTCGYQYSTSEQLRRHQRLRHSLLAGLAHKRNKKWQQKPPKKQQ